MDPALFAPRPLSAYPSKDQKANSHHPSIDQLPLSSTATLVGTDFEPGTKSGFPDKTTDLVFRTSSSSATDSDAASDTDNTSFDDSVKPSDPRTLLEQRWNASMSVHRPYPKQTWASPVLEFVACILWTSIPLMCLAAIYLGCRYLRYPMLAYFAWILMFDASTPFNGGANRGRWFARMPIWDYYRSYFSNRTILTPEAAAPGAFDAHEKFIFGYSPHGMYCLGAFASFCLPRKSDSPLPQNICLTTLGLGFFVPFFRELLFAYGFIGVGKKSVNAAFKKVEFKDGKPEKKAILICIGGAREAMWSTPGKLKIVMKKRKGFAKMAINNGAALVPVLSFGENNVFHQFPNPPGSVLRTFQEFILKYLMFSPILFTGDTFLGYLLPRRKPLVTVVGAPISPGPIDSNPTDERLDELHSLYMTKIQEIWDQYKDIYAIDRKSELEFVE